MQRALERAAAPIFKKVSPSLNMLLCRLAKGHAANVGKGSSSPPEATSKHHHTSIHLMLAAGCCPTLSPIPCPTSQHRRNICCHCCCTQEGRPVMTRSVLPKTKKVVKEVAGNEEEVELAAFLARDLM